MKTEWGLVGTQNKQADPMPIAVRVPPGHWRQNDTRVSTSITSTIAPVTQIDGWHLVATYGVREVRA